MEIDILQIAICSGLLLMAIISSLCNVFFRRLPHSIFSDNDDDMALPKFSIVIAAHDSASDLQKNLPYFLSQVYEPGYEVIVVDESSSDDTNNVLKLLKKEYKNLYTTFIPTSSKYLSRRKLALTVGVKAAHNEWIIFSDADCRPYSDKWLKAFSHFCNNENNIVMGYTQFDENTKSFYRFERMISSWYTFRKALNGMAYRHCGANLAIRKSDFMKKNGFLKNLKYLRGEYDFIVNEYAQSDRTAVVTSEASFMLQDTPSKKTWTNTRLCYMETRKHLNRSHSYRARFNIDMLMLHLNYIGQISVLVYSVFAEDIVFMIAAICCFFITVCMRFIIAKRACAFLSESISAAKIVVMEIGLLWSNMKLMIKYATSDKNDFIRK